MLWGWKHYLRPPKPTLDDRTGLDHIVFSNFRFQISKSWDSRELKFKCRNRKIPNRTEVAVFGKVSHTGLKQVAKAFSERKRTSWPTVTPKDLGLVTYWWRNTIIVDENEIVKFGSWVLFPHFTGNLHTACQTCLPAMLRIKVEDFKKHINYDDIKLSKKREKKKKDSRENGSEFDGGRSSLLLVLIFSGDQGQHC